jgi:hypothetical protein
VAKGRHGRTDEPRTGRTGRAAPDERTGHDGGNPAGDGMEEPALHTAEEATPGELRRASVRLLITLAALGLLVVPLLRELPLGQSARSGVLAWLLVALALYWLYAGMGFRPILLIQLAVFSAAAALLSAKILLVIVDIHELTVLRHAARFLILLGGGLAAANLGAMLYTLVRRGSGGRT